MNTTTEIQKLIAVHRRQMTDQIEINFSTSPQSPPYKGGEGRLTEEEREILSLLKKGRANALSVRYLAGMTNLSELEIRQVVKHLVEEHNTLIVSATSKPAGYYYPETGSEYEAGAKQLEHRIISLAKRLRAINRQAYEKIFGQRNLELEYET